MRLYILSPCLTDAMLTYTTSPPLVLLTLRHTRTAWLQLKRRRWKMERASGETNLDQKWPLVHFEYVRKLGLRDATIVARPAKQKLSLLADLCSICHDVGWPSSSWSLIITCHVTTPTFSVHCCTGNRVVTLLGLRHSLSESNEC